MELELRHLECGEPPRKAHFVPPAATRAGLPQRGNRHQNCHAASRTGFARTLRSFVSKPSDGNSRFNPNSEIGMGSTRVPQANSKPLLTVSRTAQPEELATGTNRQGDVELRVVAANRIGDGKPENGWRQVSRRV